MFVYRNIIQWKVFSLEASRRCFTLISVEQKVFTVFTILRRNRSPFASLSICVAIVQSPLRPLAAFQSLYQMQHQLKSPTQTCTEPCWAWSHSSFFTSKARRSFVRSDLSSVGPGHLPCRTLWEYSSPPQCWAEDNEIEFFSYLSLSIGTLVELLMQAYNSLTVGT